MYHICLATAIRTCPIAKQPHCQTSFDIFSFKKKESLLFGQRKKKLF
jgi:hypothetical protein